MIFSNLCPSPLRCLFFLRTSRRANTVVVITSTPAIQDVPPTAITSATPTPKKKFSAKTSTSPTCFVPQSRPQTKTRLALLCCDTGRGVGGWGIGRNADPSLSRYLRASGGVDGVSPFKPLLSTYRRRAHPPTSSELKPCLCCSVSH